MRVGRRRHAGRVYVGIRQRVEQTVDGGGVQARVVVSPVRAEERPEEPRGVAGRQRVLGPQKQVPVAGGEAVRDLGPVVVVTSVVVAPVPGHDFARRDAHGLERVADRRGGGRARSRGAGLRDALADARVQPERALAREGERVGRVDEAVRPRAPA